MSLNPANRFNLDYEAEAKSFKKFSFPIIDAHMHLHSPEGAKIYMSAARAYGIETTYSMTYLESIDGVRAVLGESIRFIAMPKFSEEEKLYHDLPAYLKLIDAFYEKGARILKLWSAPRGIDIGRNAGLPDMLTLGASRRREIARYANSRGMAIMVHVGDPDTWFKTKYSDAAVYGSKADQYIPFKRLLDEFPNKWIAAHMGGWPEDLEFLSRLLEQHTNLYLDSSATKWIVRELSKHSRAELMSFLERWRGRVFFGSDIVVRDTDLIPTDRQLKECSGNLERARELAQLEAYDLYASRYWALRRLFESDYSGESPIADPDLALVEPTKYNESDAPRLEGKALPENLIKELYLDAAANVLEPLYNK